MTTKEKIIAELIHCDRIGIDVSNSFDLFSKHLKSKPEIRIKFLQLAAATSVIEVNGERDKLCQDLIFVAQRLAHIAPEEYVSVVVDAFSELPDHIDLKL